MEPKRPDEVEVLEGYQKVIILDEKGIDWNDPNDWHVKYLSDIGTVTAKFPCIDGGVICLVKRHGFSLDKKKDEMKWVDPENKLPEVGKMVLVKGDPCFVYGGIGKARWHPKSGWSVCKINDGVEVFVNVDMWLEGIDPILITLEGE